MPRTERRWCGGIWSNGSWSHKTACPRPHNESRRNNIHREAFIALLWRPVRNILAGLRIRRKIRGEMEGGYVRPPADDAESPALTPYQLGKREMGTGNSSQAKNCRSPQGSRFFLHRREHTLRQEWCFAKPRPNGVEDGIGDGRGNRCAGRFAAAKRGHLWPVDQNDLDFGNVWKS